MRTRRDLLKLAPLFGTGFRTIHALGAQALEPGRSLPRATQPKKVLILGAGLAGLTAAYELTEAGHDVTVLEAQIRPGGRVQTLRSFADDLFADTGASRIPAIHHWTHHYAKLFDLKMTPFFPTSGLQVLYIDGRRVKLEANLNIADHLALSAEEKEMGMRAVLQKYIFDPVNEVAAAGDPKLDAWPPPSLKKFDQYTWREFLRRQGASQGALDFMLFGAVPEEVSALFILRLLAQGNYGMLTHIEGGNDHLPRAFAKKLAGKIRYGRAAVRLEQDEKQVRAVTIRNAVRETFSADYMICAIPFSTLRSIEMAPSFSRSKRRVIEELPYAAASKMFVQTRTRPWETEGLNGFARVYDSGASEILSPSWDLPGQRGILLNYAAGDAAIRAGALTEAERTDLSVKQLDRVFPGVAEICEGGASKIWDQDEWARGGYSIVTPGQYATLMPRIAAPEGRIHFAGEHTSAWPAWMQGALESGFRAASEVSNR